MMELAEYIPIDEVLDILKDWDAEDAEEINLVGLTKFLVLELSEEFETLPSRYKAALKKFKEGPCG